jgi:hypothetical protein
MISEETRRKLSESHKGFHPTEETRKKLSLACTGERNPFFGKRHTKESIEKMRVSHRGQIVSEETRRKLSEAVSGEKHPFYGTHRSEETRKNISKAITGHKYPPRSEEHRRKIGEKHKGKLVSAEARHKISEANKGKLHTEETKKKMSLAHQGEKCNFWKGGISFEPYCPKFNRELRERVRAFFGYQCVECGTLQNGYKLHIVPLCKPCHTKTNFNREYWEQHFSEIINTYYQGRCYFTSDEMRQFSNPIGVT